MDWAVMKNKLRIPWKKYRYALLILGIGILLMSIPARSEQPIPEQSVSMNQEIDLEKRLEEILSSIEGAGRVRVLLTEKTGEERIYQENNDTNNTSGTESVRVETVIVSDGSRGESGLVRKIVGPVYLGAVIICDGGDRPAVRLSVAEAVADVTGLQTDRISVLKMK